MSENFMKKLTDAAITVDKNGVAHLVLVATDLTHELVITADFSDISLTSDWVHKYDSCSGKEMDTTHKYYMRSDFSLPLSNVRMTMEKLPPPELTQAQVEELLGFKVKLVSEEKEENK